MKFESVFLAEQVNGCRSGIEAIMSSVVPSAGTPVNSVRSSYCSCDMVPALGFLVKILFYPAEGSSSFCHAIRRHIQEN